jgi:hypothetical protein
MVSKKNKKREKSAFYGTQKWRRLIHPLKKFNLRKLNEVEVRKHQIEIANRFAALGNLSDDEDINRVWESIKENIINQRK